MMTENELEEFISNTSVKGSIYGLDTVRELLELMGRPDKKVKLIHIAGTNGKGSVTAFTASILKNAGYKTGIYVSPVIMDYREKIQINGRMITKKALCEGMSIIKELIASMKNEPTLFEIETALAFWYFEREKCDIAVIETGLGGRDDATNVIDSPLVTAFTSISRDHMGILGETLGEIALIKAGIIKAGTSVVTMLQQEEAINVIKKVCSEKGVKLTEAPTPHKIKTSLLKQTFSIQGFNNLETGLLGTYQPYNAGTAIGIINELKENGFNISEKAIRKGLLDISWPGRFTVLGRKPLVIMDGAHNEGAAMELRKSVDVFLKDKPLVYIIGVFKDKEYQKVLRIMCDRPVAIVTLATPGNPRALSALELAEEASLYCQNVTSADSVEEALELATLLAGDKCAVLAFGSLSYLGRLKKAYDNVYNNSRKG